jgi:hypothetical protein
MASAESNTQKDLQDRNVTLTFKGKMVFLKCITAVRSNSNVTWLVEFTEYMTLDRAKGHLVRETYAVFATGVNQ